MDYYFIGSGELQTAFRFVGVPGAAVENAEEARAAFRAVTGTGDARCVEPAAAVTGVRILIIEEGMSPFLGEELVRWQLSGRFPLIVEIPGLAGHPEGRKTLVDAIREAIGIHV